MQLDIDKAIEILQETNADQVEYKLEKEIDGKKYSIKIEIKAQ